MPKTDDMRVVRTITMHQFADGVWNATQLVHGDGWAAGEFSRSEGRTAEEALGRLPIANV
jgi:hypothetical protein